MVIPDGLALSSELHWMVDNHSMKFRTVPVLYLCNVSIEGMQMDIGASWPPINSGNLRLLVLDHWSWVSGKMNPTRSGEAGPVVLSYTSTIANDGASNNQSYLKQWRARLECSCAGNRVMPELIERPHVSHLNRQKVMPEIEIPFISLLPFHPFLSPV